VIADGHTVYSHVRELIGRGSSPPLIVWGHSLGSAVASALVSELCQMGDPPHALILESPFNNIRDEIREHPMAFLWRKMPFFDWFFAGSLHRSDVAFFSDQALKDVHLPILILHAKDDQVVPYRLGKKLYLSVLQSRLAGRSKPVIFKSFEAEFGYAHIYLYSAPELGEIM